MRAFPRTPSRGAAQAWRAAPIPGSGVVRVRETRLDDYAAVRALQRVTAPYVVPWSLRQFESQRHVFPEGQLAAVCEGQLLGVASSLVVRWDDFGARHTWRSITADGHFTTHDPEGHTLYGVDLVVDTSRRGFGVARTLYQARRRLCRRLNLRRVIVAARMPGYRALRATLTPDMYAMRVAWGDIAEPSLRFPMSQGFQYCGVLHDYLPEDEESCGHAALLAWLNPLYAPPGPPAFEQAQRQRKCA